MQDKNHVYLRIMDYGDDAAIVTRFLGLEPTRICIPGQPIGRSPKSVYKEHAWKLSSPLNLSTHIDEHFGALLHLLEPHAAAIKTASEIWSGGINAAIYYEDWTPGIHFSEDVLEIAASMNLSFDLDLYFFGTDKS